MTADERRAEIFARPVAALDALRALLDGIADDAFYMGEFWLPTGERFNDQRNRMERVAPGPCGCLIGHAVHAGMVPLLPPALLPSMGSDDVYRLASDAFGIYSTDLVRWFADPFAYVARPVTRADVARRIDFLRQECAQARDAIGLAVRHVAG